MHKRENTIVWLVTPYSSYGGVHRHLTYWASGFVGKGFNVHLILSPLSHEDAQRARDTFSNFSHIFLHFIPLYPPYKKLRGFIDLVRLLSSLAPDVLHTISIHADILGGMALTFLRNQTKHISSVEGRLMPLDKCLKTTIMRLMYRKVLFRMTCLIAISSATKQQLVTNFGVPSHKVQVLHSGIVPAQYKFKRYLWPYYGNPRFSVGWIGRLSEDKGISFFIEAIPFIVEKIPQATFIIAGHGPLDEIIRSRIRDLRMSDRVHMVGWKDDINAVYNEIDVLVFSSPFGGIDGLPWTILEALATGTPVVSSAVAGVPEIITHLETGILLHNLEPREIAQEVIRLFKEPALARRIGQTGRERIEREFTTYKEIQKLMEIYATVIG